jgi:ABC-type multidrug transport system fused ATPase/permease subunit
VIARALDHYLTWFGAELGPFWTTPWGAFDLLMLTLIGVYAVWAVALYYRSQWAQLAGHRVMMDLRSDLYRHIHRLGHSFFKATSPAASCRGSPRTSRWRRTSWAAP